MNFIQEKKASNLQNGKDKFDVWISDHYLLFINELTKKSELHYLLYCRSYHKKHIDAY